MPQPFAVFWDFEEGGNAEHLLEHGVSADEAEQIIDRYFDQREPSRSTPEYFVVRGFTEAGRFLLVVFEYLDDEDVVIPVTAYEPEVLP